MLNLYFMVLPFSTDLFFCQDFFFLPGAPCSVLALNPGCTASALFTLPDLLPWSVKGGGQPRLTPGDSDSCLSRNHPLCGLLPDPGLPRRTLPAVDHPCLSFLPIAALPGREGNRSLSRALPPLLSFFLFTFTHLLLLLMHLSCSSNEGQVHPEPSACSIPGNARRQPSEPRRTRAVGKADSAPGGRVNQFRLYHP